MPTLEAWYFCYQRFGVNKIKTHIRRTTMLATEPCMNAFVDRQDKTEAFVGSCLSCQQTETCVLQLETMKLVHRKASERPCSGPGQESNAQMPHLVVLLGRHRFSVGLNAGPVFDHQ